MTKQNPPPVMGRLTAVLTLVFALSLQLFVHNAFATENHRQHQIMRGAITPAPSPAPAKPATPADTTQPSAADTAQTLAGKTVMIDPGHGGKMPGAIRNKVVEKDLNLAIALKLKTRLEALGATVVMTRIDDSDISLADRTALSNALKPDIFVSVHTNSNRKAAVRGIETYYYSAESKRLAQLVYASLTSGLKEPGNWVAWEELYVLHHNDRVSILAEVGYLSHVNTRARLVKDAYQNQVADALCDGIERYFQELAAQSGGVAGQQPQEK